MAAGKMEKSDRRFYFWAPRRMLTLGALGGTIRGECEGGEEKVAAGYC